MWSRYGYVRLRSSHFSIRVMIDGPPFVHVREDPSNVAAPTHSLCGDKVGQLNDIADPSQQVVCSTMSGKTKHLDLWRTLTMIWQSACIHSDEHGPRQGTLRTRRPAHKGSYANALHIQFKRMDRDSAEADRWIWVYGTRVGQTHKGPRMVCHDPSSATRAVPTSDGVADNSG